MTPTSFLEVVKSITINQYYKGFAKKYFIIVRNQLKIRRGKSKLFFFHQVTGNIFCDSLLQGMKGA
jgi:hypothetical protein